MRTRLFAALLALVGFASSCTFELRDPGVTVVCDPLVFEINTHQAGLGDEQFDAIVTAFTEFGELVGRDVVYNGTTTTTYLTHTADDPVLVELTWPEDAPNHLGFAQAAIENGRYVSGWIYFNPAIGHAPPEMVRRLVMHEIGHLYGLLDVEDTSEMMNPALTTDNWGDGDLAGLSVTHDTGCSDNQLLETLADTAAREANFGLVSDIHNGEAFTSHIGPDAHWQTLLANHIAAHTPNNNTNCSCTTNTAESQNDSDSDSQGQGDGEGELVTMIGTTNEDDDEDDTHRTDCGCTTCC